MSLYRAISGLTAKWHCSLFSYDCAAHARVSVVPAASDRLKKVSQVDVIECSRFCSAHLIIVDRL